MKSSIRDEPSTEISDDANTRSFLCVNDEFRLQKAGKIFGANVGLNFDMPRSER